MRTASVAPLAGLLLLSGCFWATTKSEGKKMRSDIAGLEERMKTQETSLEAKVEQLEDVLDKATKLLARNSADIGAELESLGREQANITGLIMEAKRLVDDATKEIASMRADYEKRIAELEQRMVIVEQRMGGVGPATHKTAAELYAEGKQAFDAGDTPKAQAAFRNLVVKYPADDKAAEAQYLRAETHFRTNDFENAVKEFQKVFDKYAKSDYADDAVYRAGESAEKLKWCTDALAYYGLLRQSFPRSPLAKKALARDKAIKKVRSNKAKCAS